MSVMIETSVGTLVIDLHSDRCPLTTKNFLKLCKMKYYNHCLFHSVQKDFIAQTGDPTGKGTGGDSIYKFLYGDQARFFTDEIHQDLKHSKIGTIAMASAGENLNASQFYITLRDELDYLDGKHTVFGEVAEGFDTLTRINESFVDEKGRPYKNIRIKHTYILDDPFDDPPQLADLIPESSPEPRPLEEGEEVRLEDDWVPMDEQIDPEELEKSLREKEAHSRAVVLEMIGDIPEAEVKPPENVLFVCKLNPVTQEEDLDVIFSRFGKVVSADIIKDYKTGDSLCYAFIEFEDEQACERAYFAMDNVLIDDRRIHVDFSQSVSKLWNQYNRTGKQPGDQGQRRKNGCFKCGEIGHIAKECPNDMDDEGINTTEQKPKYVLKDNNKQLGDTGKRYDMVFEEDFANNSQTKHQHNKYASKKDRDARQGKKDSRQGRNERYEHDYTERNRHSKNTTSSREAKNSQDRDSTDSRYFDKHHSSSKHRYHDHREADRYIGDGDKHRDRHGRDRYREEDKEKKRHRHKSVEESDCEDEKIHQKRRLQKDIRTHDSNGRVISRHEGEKR